MNDKFIRFMESTWIDAAVTHSVDIDSLLVPFPWVVWGVSVLSCGHVLRCIGIFHILRIHKVRKVGW